jgi:hypothetical protein
VVVRRRPASGGSLLQEDLVAVRLLGGSEHGDLLTDDVERSWSLIRQDNEWLGHTQLLLGTEGWHGANARVNTRRRSLCRSSDEACGRVVACRREESGCLL